jgi:hypothetical protein
VKPRKPLKWTALKPPTVTQVEAWRAKPRHALPRGKRPKRQGRRAKREEAAWQAGRAAVVERSGGFCEFRHVAGVHDHLLAMHSAHHVHHILSRGRGGSHDPENLIHLCAALHDFLHSHPAWAQSVGLLESKVISGP